MTIVNVSETYNSNKYLVITQQKDPESLITTRILITDNSTNQIKIIDISKGPQGNIGPQGIQGLPGKDATTFDILPISSGGTNNTSFVNNKIIYFDGDKLSSSDYTFNDILSINNANAITGIIAGTGLSKVENGSQVTLNVNIGEGLTTNNNQILIDDTIARRVELTVGNISGILGISKGGTNNSSFLTNYLVYYDGTKLSSFPLATGRIVTSGSTINIVAGSGLIGGGNVSLPNGSIVLNIGSSQDVIVSENAIELSSTGIAGTYSKITTDSKGRVISGVNLTSQDIINILGFTPWHSGNDGSGSLLDADKLDGKDSTYFLNFNNLTGTINTSILPNSITNTGIYTKVTVNSKGLVINGTGLDYSDITGALRYRPVSVTGDNIYGNINLYGDLNLRNGNLTLEDNLPIFAAENSSLTPSDPRGFSFVYGTINPRTGILAYYPNMDQLRLVTNIFGTGENGLGGGDSQNGYDIDIDGGDASSIFLLGNLDGDQSVVLLENIADKKYVSLTSNQIISGLKYFNSPLSVNRYIDISSFNHNGPALILNGNNNLIPDLNADFLDGNHGDYYTNAENLTGTLYYQNVTVTNLEGEDHYLAMFDDRGGDQDSGISRTVSSSIVKQSGSSIIIQNPNTASAELSVGDNNPIVGTNSTAIGMDNLINSDNSLAVGQNNTINGYDSVGINSGSLVNSDYSFAMGKHGTTWIENQFSIGAFEERYNNSRLYHGQLSTTAIGFKGDTQDTWQKLSPDINIPNNKTILYNIELIFSKYGGTGVAAFNFSSGIIKNINGTNYLIQPDTKTEIHNDSQIRDYIYGLKLGSNDTEYKKLHVLYPPIENNDLQIQNLNPVLKIRPELTEQHGHFDKTYDGKIILTMDKPISSGWSTSYDYTKYIDIKSYNHKMVTGCLVNIFGLSGNPLTMASGPYEVHSIYDKNNFSIIDHSWSGRYLVDNSIAYLFISDNSLSGSQYTNNRSFSGSIVVSSPNNSYIQTQVSNLNKYINPGMKINISSLHADEIDTTFCNSGIFTITDVIGSDIYIDPMIFEDAAGRTDIKLFFTPYTYGFNRFLSSEAFFIDTIDYGDFVRSNNSFIPSDSGIYLRLDTNNPDLDLDPVIITPLFNSTGNITLNQKRNYSGVYDRSTQFTEYNGIYTQFPSISDTGLIWISGSQTINSILSGYNPYIKFFGAKNVFSGNLTNNSNIITGCYPPQIGRIHTDMVLHSPVPGFALNNTVISISQNGQDITMSSSFTGNSTGVFITYSGDIPLNNNYEILSIIDDKQLFLKRIYNQVSESGAYVSGTVKFYTDYGIGTVSITTDDPLNVANDESVYINFLNKDNVNALIPVSDNYVTYDAMPGEFKVTSYYLMPDSGVSTGGDALFTLDKDHGYLPINYETNSLKQIPLKFLLPSEYSSFDGYFTTGNFSVEFRQDAETKPSGRLLYTLSSIPDTLNIPYSRITGLHIKDETDGISTTGIISLNTSFMFDDSNIIVLENDTYNDYEPHIPIITGDICYYTYIEKQYSINNLSRTPKSGLFNIIAVTGHKIVINDDKNQLLEEINKDKLWNGELPADSWTTVPTDTFGIYKIRMSGLHDYFNINDKLLVYFSDLSNNLNNKPLKFKINDIDREEYDYIDAHFAYRKLAATGVDTSVRFEGKFFRPLPTGINPNDLEEISLNQGTNIGNFYTEDYGPNYYTTLPHNYFYGTMTSGSNTISNLSLSNHKTFLNMPISGLYKNNDTNNFIFFTGLIENKTLNPDSLTLREPFVGPADTVVEATLFYLSDYSYEIFGYSDNNWNIPYTFNDDQLFNFNLSGPSLRVQTYFENDDAGVDLYGQGSLTYRSRIPVPRLFYTLELIEDDPALRLKTIKALQKNLVGYDIKYIGYQDGSVYSPLNNIYFHSHGTKDEYWKRDSTGKLIDHPLTGTYFVHNAPSLCRSGTMCVHITGISNINRFDPGDSVYLDFIDGGSALNGLYTVNDKLLNNFISFNMPYNSDYINSYGLVYLIDSSTDNIKTNKNPNYNNIFTLPSITTASSNIYSNKFSQFNSFNNRWKHLIEIDNQTEPQVLENESISIGYNGDTSQESIDIIILTPMELDFEVEYGINDIFTATIDNKIEININQSYQLKIITTGGAGNWADPSQNPRKDIPYINILGLKNYSIRTDDIIYDDINKQWEIIVDCEAIPKEYAQKQIIIRVADQSDRKNKNYYLEVIAPLTITNIENTIYGITSSSTNWRLYFEVYDNGQNPLEGIGISIDNIGSNSYYEPLSAGINDNGINGDWKLYCVNGQSSQTGIFAPVITATKGDQTATITGVLKIFDDSSKQKPYDISFRALKSNYNINYSSDSSTDLFFIVPFNEFIDSDNWFNLSFKNVSSNLSINNVTISYPEQDFPALLYRANINGNIGFYQPIISGSIQQPSGDQLITTTKETGLNITIYDPIYVDSSELVQPLDFIDTKPWAVDFYVKGGGSAKRYDYPPKVYLGNIPNNGNYLMDGQTKLIEYNTGYEYDFTNNWWKIKVTGTQDLYGNYAAVTGSYPLYIYIEDDASSYSGYINYITSKKPYMANIRLDKYLTPNNSLEFNVDIKDTPYSSSESPSISIEDGGTQGDPIANSVVTHKKYDKHTNVWETYFSGQPITNKWDARTRINNNNNDFEISCKGILDEKIIVAGKLNMVETEGAYAVFSPLVINNVRAISNPYEAEPGGDPWAITFNTAGGLEDFNYPPQIFFQGFPTPCTGYDPSLDNGNINTNNQCFGEKKWDASSKTWEFKFSGIQSCIADTEFPITIIARDKKDNQIITGYGHYDIKYSMIKYKKDQAFPNPVWSGDSETTLYPQCQTYSSDRWYYKTVNRDKCPSPTGFSGLIIWGSLPQGLKLIHETAFVPEFNPLNAGRINYSLPYSNTNPSYFRITGYPTEFAASGSNYPNELKIAVVDARGNSGVKTITFTDGSRAMQTSATDMTIYFANSGYSYSPRLISNNGAVGSLGSKIIGQSGDNTQDVLRPSISPQSMMCLSILPHSNCFYSTGIYRVESGGNDISFSGYGTKSSLFPENKIITSSEDIYLEFDSALSSENGINTAIRLTDNGSPTDILRITANGSYSQNTTGWVKILKIYNNLIKNKQIDDIDYKNGSSDGFQAVSPSLLTTTGLLGGGSYVYQQDKYGFLGKMKPSFTSRIKVDQSTSSRIYSDDFDLNDAITMSLIPGQRQDPYVIKFSNTCYETGFLRVSGIVIPSPTLELTDDPPGKENYSYPNSSFSVVSRLAYGETSNDRAIQDNQRNKSFYYTIKDAITNLPISSYTTPKNSTSQTSFLIGNSDIGLNIIPSSTVLALHMNYYSSIPFPTYDKQAIPDLHNVYYWVHSTGNTNIGYNSFPAHIIVDNFDIITNSGAVLNKSLNILGGYIKEYSDEVPYQSYIDYPPNITGLIQQNISKIYYAGYIQSPNDSNVIINLPADAAFQSGDPISLSFKNDPSITLPYIDNIPLTGILLSSIDASNNIIIQNDSSNNLRTGIVEIRDSFLISGVNNNSNSELRILVKKDSLSSISVSGTQIDLLNIYNSRSTQNNLFRADSYYFDDHQITKDYRLIIVSGDSDSVYAKVKDKTQIVDAQNTWYLDLLSDSSGYCHMRKIITNTEIVTTGVSFNKVGHWISSITGIPLSLYGQYIYKTITCENSNNPDRNNDYGNVDAKIYSKDFNLTINIPPKIISSNPRSVAVGTTGWAMSFAVTGGNIPRSSYPLEVELDGFVHIFNKSENVVSDSGVIVTLTSSYSGIFNGGHSPVLTVYDMSGGDSITLNKL
jgi:hypothetical protein